MKQDPKDTLEALKVVIQHLEAIKKSMQFTIKDGEEKTFAEIVADLDWKLWELLW
jgi:hypothetical protein